jgi:hypothetical protein
LHVIIIIIFVTLIIFLVALSAMQAKKRRDELQRWAATRGLSFSADSDSSIDDRFPNFPCLREGDDRHAFNVMQGAIGKRSILAFDYHYETHSTDSKGHRTTHSHEFSAVIVRPGVPLRPLSIRGETFFDKVGAFMGFEDINFESAEFNRRFYVKSPDRRWAFDVLHQDTMEFLLEAPRFSLEMDESCVIAYRDSEYAPGDFEAALGVLEGILDRIPASILQDLKGTNE